MGVKASTWAWAQNGLSPSEKLLLMALADHADDDGVCWPGQKVLCQKTGFHRSTVSTLAKSLRDRGLIQIERRKYQGVQKSNRYKLNLGLMLIPCRPTLHGHVVSGDTGMSPLATLETSIEPSEGTINGEQSLAEDTMPKEFGQGSVEEALKSSTTSDVSDPTDAIPGLTKKGTKYLVSSLERIFRIAYKYHGFGFLAESTMKQKGQFRQFQDKLAGIDAAEVICYVLAHWSTFREKSDFKKPPHKPNIGFLLLKVSLAGDMYVQSIAQTEKSEVKPLFGKSKSQENLTNETETEDNSDDLEWLESLDT